MCTGVTPDISAYLQFTFWEAILFLDSEESWPHTKEHPGRWLGVAHNIGDALTYWIFDDQSKQVLARSVMHPFNRNKRVFWDPVFNDPIYSGTKKERSNIEDVSTPEGTSEVTKDPDLISLNMAFDPEMGDYLPIEKEDEYKGPSRLSYGNSEIPIDKEIPYITWSKQKSMDTLEYKEKSFKPPKTNQEVELKPRKKGPKTTPKEIPINKVETKAKGPLP
jgi:hypothetical protein